MIYDYNLLLLRSPSISFPSKFLSPPSIHPSLPLSLPPSLPPSSLPVHTCMHTSHTHTPHHTHAHITHTHIHHTHTQHPTHNTQHTHTLTFVPMTGRLRQTGRNITLTDWRRRRWWRKRWSPSPPWRSPSTHAHRSVASFRWRKTLTTHVHCAGQWPVSGKKADYTCTQRRSVANVGSKKHWLHMHAAQACGQCQVKKALTAQCRSVASVRSKKHWLHMRTAQVSGWCQVKKALTTHVCRSMASFRDGSALNLTREKSQGWHQVYQVAITHPGGDCIQPCLTWILRASALALHCRLATDVCIMKENVTKSRLWCPRVGRRHAACTWLLDSQLCFRCFHFLAIHRYMKTSLLSFSTYKLAFQNNGDVYQQACTGPLSRQWLQEGMLLVPRILDGSGSWLE